MVIPCFIPRRETLRCVIPGFIPYEEAPKVGIPRWVSPP